MEKTYGMKNLTVVVWEKKKGWGGGSILRWNSGNSVPVTAHPITGCFIPYIANIALRNHLNV